MNLYVTRTGVRLSRLVFAAIAGLVTVVLMVTVLPGYSYAADPEPTKKADESVAAGDSDGDGVADRPDGTSAAITARLSGKRVEDMSKRTETSQTFVNADGTLTDEQYGSPVRVQDEDGAWEGVDLDLVEQTDGSYAPKASTADVTVNGGSSKEAARVTFDDERSVAVTWPEALPEPTVDGGVATYKVSDTADLLVTTTSGGVTTRIRLNEQPAQDDQVFKLGLRAEGVDVDQTSSGGLTVTDGDDTIARVSNLVAWDAKVDDAGDPVEVVAMDASLEETGTKGDVTSHDLELTPPDGFLADPSTVYPVILDPDISMGRTRDTWVRNGDTGVHGSENKLIVGKINPATTTNPGPTRSFLKFSNSSIRGTGVTILKAELGLFQYYAYTCADRQMNVYGVTEAWSDAIRWTNMPAVSSGVGSGSMAVLPNRGATGCVAGAIEVNVRAIAQRWSDGQLNMEGLRLNASDETVSSYERRFCSMDLESDTTCQKTDRIPYLKVTYNSAPNVPTGLKVSPSTSAASALWTTAAKPKVSVTLSDPEKQNIRAQFEVKNGATAVAVTDSASIASGGTVTKEFPTLSDGTYTVRVRANDGEMASAWSTVTTLKVDTGAPAAPAVTCTNATSGSWYDTRPSNLSSTSCTVAGGSDVVGFEWTKGNKPQPSLIATSGGNATLGTFSIPVSGVFGVSVRARDAAGNLSAPGSFGFGTGDAGFIVPVDGERTTSSVEVEAVAPTGAESARIEHRATGDESAPWVVATHVRRAESAWPWVGAVTSSGTNDTTGRLVWTVAEEDGVTAPSIRDTRVCFVYSGVTRCTPGRKVSVAPSAFGGAYASEEIGPGEVALMTGEFQISETDVETPSYAGSLSIGRTYRSFAGPASPAANVLGPGWVADLEGPGSGGGSYSVVDKTSHEAAISLIDPEGETYTYLHEDNVASGQRLGNYVGDAETKTDNDELELTSSGGTKYLTLSEDDGTTTIWKHAGSGQWLIESITDPADVGATTYSHNSDGLVTGIYSPTPSGAACGPTSQDAECRVILLKYGLHGGSQRLDQVDLRTWDARPKADGTPGTSAGIRTIAVRKYEYDAGGLLVATWDPRTGDETAALKTTYEYELAGSAHRLSKVGEPGETPWRLEYGPDGRLKAAKRSLPSSAGSGDATWNVIYDLPVTGTGLPDLRLAEARKWGQPQAPVRGAAIFGPDAPNLTDYTYASLKYWDIEGRQTNSASFGAGAWRIDTKAHDQSGNELWALSAGNREAALSSGGDTESVAHSLAELTFYNESATRIEETWGPTRSVVLKDGSTVPGRAGTITVYDDEAAAANVPTPGRPTASSGDLLLNLPVEERNVTMDSNGVLYDIQKTRYRYDPVQAGDGSGWDLGTPTRTLTQLGGSWSTEIERFGVDGKTIETRTAEGAASNDGSGSDPRSTNFVYYSADGSSPVQECRNRPEWVGMECVAQPGGQPSSGAAVPSVFVTGYDYLLNATRTEERSGSQIRTSITQFDQAGRLESEKVAISNARAVDKPVSETTYGYSSVTGELTTTTRGAVSMTSTTDSWGRVSSQSDGMGNTGTTSYDNAGRVKTFNDGKGTYTYTYDGADANGKVERRGLVTKMDVGLASGPSEFAFAHDPDGTADLTIYPNGAKAVKEIDSAGSVISLRYEDSAGNDLAAFSEAVDSESRVRLSESSASAQTYSYDGRSRLVEVQDEADGFCTGRKYAYSLDSNRNSLTTNNPAPDGSCSNSGVVESAAFDSADRIIDSGYSYDALGRTLTVPAVDTDDVTAGQLGIAYYDNDMVAKLSRTVGAQVNSKSFTLDPGSRLSEVASSVDGAELLKSSNHYANDTDSPAWVGIQSRPDAASAWASSWTRNVLGPDGDLVLSQPSSGVATVQIANLHGDLVAQLPNVPGAAESMDSWSESTEFGVARKAASASAGSYGWLGTMRRATDSVGGLVLMGARLYNPTTGRFLSRDAVAGANDNSYVYPADPVNQFDTSGEGWFSKIKKKAKKAGKKIKKSLKKASKKVKRAVTKSKKWLKSNSKKFSRRLEKIPGGKRLLKLVKTYGWSAVVICAAKYGYKLKKGMSDATVRGLTNTVLYDCMGLPKE